MPRLKFLQVAPRCRCDVVPHRCWCPRKPFNDRAYDRIVAEHAKGVRTRNSPYQSVRGLLPKEE